MLMFKQGVGVSGLQPEMLRALDHATAIYSLHDKDCVCTSAREGKHRNYSHHYKGLAIDLRTRHLTEPEKIKISEQLQSNLGTDYQVILEATHIHVEYDPQEASPTRIF